MTNTTRISFDAKATKDIILKALRVAGTGFSRIDIVHGKDKRLSLLESDILRTCGPFSAFETRIAEAEKSCGDLFSMQSLSKDEIRTRTGLSVLEDLLELLSKSKEGDRKVLFACEALRNTTGICGVLGISSPTVGFVRLVADTCALGAFDSPDAESVESPCIFWPAIARDWKDVFFETIGETIGFESSPPEERFFPAMVLDRLFRTGNMFGFGDIPGYCDTFGKYDAQDIAEAIVPEMKRLAAAALGDATEKDIIAAPGGAGLGTLWILAGNIPSSPDFWIPKNAFERRRTEKVRISESNPGRTPLRALGFELLQTGDEEDARLGHAAFLVSNFVSGRFNMLRYERTRDTFSSSSFDVNVPSVFEQTTIERPKGERCVGRSCGMFLTAETEGFRKHIDELGGLNPTARFFRDAFLAECLDAVAIPGDFEERNAALFSPIRDENDVSPLLSKAISPWLGNGLSASALSGLFEEREFKRSSAVPASAHLASISTTGARFRASLLAVELGRISRAANGGELPFRDAAAVAALLSDGDFRAALAASFPEHDGESGEFLLSAASSILSFAPENVRRKDRLADDIVTDEDLERRRRNVLEQTLGDFVRGMDSFLGCLAEKNPEDAEHLFRAFRAMLSEYKASRPSVSDIEGILEPFGLDEKSFTENKRGIAELVHLGKSVEIPEMMFGSGEGEPGV